MFARGLLALCLAAVIAVAIGPPQPAHARVSNPPAADLSLESISYSGSTLQWTVIVRNNPVPGHPATEVRNVVVRITAEARGQEYSHSGEPKELSPGTAFDASTGLLTISSIPAFGSAQARFLPTRFFNGPVAQDTPFRLYAQIVRPALLVNAPAYRANDETEIWYVKPKAGHLNLPNTDAGVQVRVDNRLPARGRRATFEVKVGYEFFSTPTPVASNTNATLWDVRLKVELSPGLSFFAATPDPADTPFDHTSGAWDVGAIDTATGHILSVEVDVTNEDIPLEQRCLTATVVMQTPPYALDPEKRKNDRAKVCLGKDPPVVVSEGEIVLWWLHDCVGVTAIPCSGADELKLFARADHADVALPTVQRRDVFGGPIPSRNSGATYLDPDSVVIQVYPSGKRRCEGIPESCFWVSGEVQGQGHLGSLTYGDAPVIIIKYPRQSDGYSQHTFGISDVSPKQRGGTLSISRDNRGSFELLNVDGKPTLGPVNLTNSSESPDPLLLRFGALGTYKVKLTFAATKSSTKYTANGIYTFHVGPIADLEVRDGGASRLAAPGQRTYTIVAANNGPDPAPAVEVQLSGVPPGAEAIVSDGQYRQVSCGISLCQGVWDLGLMPVSSVRIPSGQSPFPTLTLIAPDGADAPTHITASIVNTKDYEVTIDGEVHSTHYFDYIAENSENVQIAARPGTGEAAGVPQLLRLHPIPDDLGIALLQWNPVERLNGWPVSGYEVHQSAPPCQRPAFDAAGEAVRGTLYLDTGLRPGVGKCYAVRAVNDQGVGGYWSALVSTGDENVVRGVTLSRTELSVREDGGTASYTVALDGWPESPVTIDLASDDAGAARVFPNRLTFHGDNWNVPQQVTVTGVNDDIDNPDNRRVATIRHTARGAGYGDVSIAPVVVTVVDDEGAGVSVSPETLRGTGKGSIRNYTITLDSEPADDVLIGVASSDDGTASVHPVLLRFTSGNWHSPQSVAVRFQAERGSATITHTAESEDPNYDGIAVAPVAVEVESAAKPTVSIEAGPCVLGGEKARFTLRAGTALAEDLAVSYRVGRNWRAVAENHMGSRSATIPAGAESVGFEVPTQDPPEAGEPIQNDGRIRPSGVPGTATVILSTSPEYDIAGERVAHVFVYHTDESRYCQR